MRKYVRVTGIATICAAAMMSSGCMGLSLFSSTHTHHHGDVELQKRVEILEQRLEAAEKGRTSEVTK